MVKTSTTQLTDRRILRLLHNSRASAEIPQIRAAIRHSRRRTCCRNKVNMRAMVKSVKRTVMHLPAKQKERAFQIMGIR